MEVVYWYHCEHQHFVFLRGTSDDYSNSFEDAGFEVILLFSLGILTLELRANVATMYYQLNTQADNDNEVSLDRCCVNCCTISQIRHTDTTLTYSILAESTVNACFWTAFGIGIMDLVILIPNGLGAILGFIQVFLCLIAPRKEILVSGETEQDSEDIDDEEEAGAVTTNMEAANEESNHAAASGENVAGKVADKDQGS